MSGFRFSGDDQILTDLDLEEIAAIEAREINKTIVPSTIGNSTVASANNVFDDDDDEILIIGERLSEQAKNCETKFVAPAGQQMLEFNVLPAKVKSQPKQESLIKDQNRAKRDLGNVHRKQDGEGKDDGWKGFVKWFEKQQIFQTPWFQTIPITRLNGSQCESIITSCTDVGHLIKFAKLLVSFLKEDTGKNDTGYFMDVSHAIEMLCVRFDSEPGIFSPTSQSQKEDLIRLYEEISKGYVTGKLYHLSITRVPELLVNLHPKSLEGIVCEALNRENVELLLPICLNSPLNFLKIMQNLHSVNICSNAGIEDDPDFSNHTNPTHKLAVKLLESLEEKLGLRYLQILPTQFQAIFSFDSAVNKNRSKYSGNEAITNEIFSILNDLFSGCAGEDWRTCEFIKFMLTLLPFTSMILSEKKLVSNRYPYLYMHVKIKRW